MTKIVNWICRVIARSVHWSPVGRKAIFRFGEGPAPLLERSYTGFVEAVAPKSEGGLALTLVLELPVNIAAGSQETTTRRVVATPRWRGDTPYRLLLGSFFVNLADAVAQDQRPL